MELPKPQKDMFIYDMILLFRVMDNHLLKNIPIGLFRELGVEEQASLMATLLSEVD